MNSYISVQVITSYHSLPIIFFIIYAWHYNIYWGYNGHQDRHRFFLLVMRYMKLLHVIKLLIQVQLLRHLQVAVSHCILGNTWTSTTATEYHFLILP